jgi:hypothetical protein
MSSILKKLNDDDLDFVRHLIRKDAMGDLEIFAEAEKRLPKSVKPPKTDDAKVMVISRYRKSGEYKRWEKAWENRDLDLKKSIALQKQRFELLSNLVKTPGQDGMETLSKSLQARLLTLAAEASDEELIEGTTKSGWIKNVIKTVQEQAKFENNSKADELKKEIDRLSNGGEQKVDPKKLVERVDELMGLKKK